MTNKLLYVGFNQDRGCIACGTEEGFRIHNCEPFKETWKREFKGGIGRVEMLFRSNLLALIGGGPKPQFPPNKVVIWDDHQNRMLGELVFRANVLSVLMNRERIVVVLEHKVYVYNFAELKLLDSIETSYNSKGLCVLCSTHNAVACPGLMKGHMRIEHYDLKKTTLIPAHETSLACFALNSDFSQIATASEQGTLIRVFDAVTGNKLQQVRRGIDPAEIYSICFNSSSEWLAVSSAKGTIHVFSLNHLRQRSNPLGQNTTSALSWMKSVLPSYFSSEWSLAQVHLPGGDKERTTIAFESKSEGSPEGVNLYVIGAQGCFHKITFDPAKPKTTIQVVLTDTLVTK